MDIAAVSGMEDPLLREADSLRAQLQELPRSLRDAKIDWTQYRKQSQVIEARLRAISHTVRRNPGYRQTRLRQNRNG